MPRSSPSPSAPPALAPEPEAEAEGIELVEVVEGGRSRLAGRAVLDPLVEERADAGRAERALRHRPAQCRTDGGRIVDVVLEARRRNAGGDLDHRVALIAAAALFEQQLQVLGESRADAGSARQLGGGAHGVGRGHDRGASGPERVERPARSLAELAARVLVVGGSGRQQVGRDDAGLHEFAQERARRSRCLLGRPPRSGEQQFGASTGEGDVGESSLFICVALAVLFGER